jgi:hypothetical protein
MQLVEVPFYVVEDNFDDQNTTQQASTNYGMV